MLQGILEEWKCLEEEYEQLQVRNECISPVEHLCKLF